MGDQRRHRALLAPLAVLLLACWVQRGALAKGPHATIAYTLRGSQTVIGPSGKPGEWGVGGQVLLDLALSDGSGGSGSLAGHCHIVAKAGADAWKAVCTKHLDWADGSTMTAHATETLGPGRGPVKARMVIAGGVGRWEGAHGEDAAYTFDPSSGRGSGTIVLNCLKGVC